MNRKKRELIEALAESIRFERSIPCPIKNINTLVTSLGGELSLVNDPLLLGGRIYKFDSNENCKFRIEIRRETSESRKMFTVAHELGHLFIHMGYLYKPEVWEEQKTADYFLHPVLYEKEYEAIEFASALLMPKEELSQYIEDLDGSEVNLSDVADHFNVSTIAAFNRCKSLDLIENPSA